jgi:hypothetical protein
MECNYLRPGRTCLAYCAKGYAGCGKLLIVQSFIVFGLFAATQDFGTQHYYLLIPGIALRVAVMVIGLWAQITNGFWRAASVGLVFTTLLASSATVFYPRAGSVSDNFGSLVPQIRYYPLVRNDLDVLWHLLDRLDELELDQRRDIYVLASSELYLLPGSCKSNTIPSACRGPARDRCPGTGSNGRPWDWRILPASARGGQAATGSLPGCSQRFVRSKERT